MRKCVNIVPTNVKGVIHLRPEYDALGKDIMMKGNEFYAAYNEETGMWTKNLVEVMAQIDDKMEQYASEHYTKSKDGGYLSEQGRVIIDYLHRFSTGQLPVFNTWLNNLPKNFNYEQLDNDITFADDVVTMKDKRSKRLSYYVGPGDTMYYDMFMNTCYAPSEREKLEWAIGSIFCGDSKKLQRFVALYGKPGTGKSTFLDIVELLFEDYLEIINVDALVSRSNQFGTSAFKNNPLVCIQHDADLSKIEKNDVLNSIVSHERIIVNEKNVKQYTMRMNAMIFIGTNEVVNISDTRQGITRRMIDVYPTGKVLPEDVYNDMKKGIHFELGAIAQHCIDVYKKIEEEEPDKYRKYRPSEMIKKTNVYANFVSDKYFDLCDKSNDPIMARDLYRMFKTYLEENGYNYIPTMARFRETMLDFYDDFKERDRIDGKQVRSVFVGFKKDCLDDMMSCVRNKEVDIDAKVNAKANEDDECEDDEAETENVSRFRGKFILHSAKGNDDGAERKNVLDNALSACPAQLSSSAGTPRKPWDECKTTLRDIDTSKEHYVRPPLNLICIDFDLKNCAGQKDLERNLEAAETWPLTYAETSKSGQGLHLYYWYDGDASKLSSVYSPGIEVKVFTGKSSLRRRLLLFNDEDISVMRGGLPLKEVKKVVKAEVLSNEKALRTFILRNLNKEYHAYTKPSIDFIKKGLDDAYESGMHYDVSDLTNAILAFANGSTNNAQYCLKVVSKMKFKSEEPSSYVAAKDDTLVFFDIEVFPNLLLICYKEEGEGKEVKRLFNPAPSTVGGLFDSKLVAYNNRKYDNHILYARYMGYTNDDIYRLSRKLVDDDPKVQLAAGFAEAYNLSYLDVYDMCSKKQSLKKWEIELGIHHQENSYPWDEPLDESHWDEVADYCCNDVIACEAVFNKNKADFVAREILADLSGLTVNHTTRQHATKIIFGDDRNPELVYTDLSKEFPGYKFSKGFLDPSEFNGYDPNDKKTWRTGEHSVYLGEAPSEGGWVAYKEGIWLNVGLLDIESLHPHTIKALNLFGKYTKNFTDILDARLAIKHGDYETARKMFDGKLAKYLDDPEMADQLSYALKIVINSVYGYTSASFINPFRDARNVDNIVAKRGALFMILLTKTLDKMGIPWVHVKTDSIKIPGITPEIVDFVKSFGKKYGYNFDHESTYREMCLVNKSTYIAKVESGKHAGEWVGVAAQFQHPYVMKTLFTKEDIQFDDICETKEVKTTMVIDFNEGLGEDGHKYQFIGRVGRFVPVKEGCGGGILLRDKGKIYDKQLSDYKKKLEEGKKAEEPSRYASVTGADGYRWLDAEILKDRPFDEVINMIDMTYFRKLVDDALDTINKYGDAEEFIRYGNMSSEELASLEFPMDDDALPF